MDKNNSSIKYIIVHEKENSLWPCSVIVGYAATVEEAQQKRIDYMDQLRYSYKDYESFMVIHADADTWMEYILILEIKN